MSFEGIQSFLLKYNQYLFHKDVELKKIHEIIVRVSGVPVLEEEIVMKKGELHITGSSVFQNELFFYRGKIIEELHKNGITTITEIR